MDRTREPLPTRVRDTAPLSRAYSTALDDGLDALDLHLTTEARAAIDGHARLLLAWTAAINLTAIRDPAAVAIAHVVDSLSGVEELRRRGVNRSLDLGSGGGYPGIPIAAALPLAHAVLLEPVAKKARFLAVAAAATGLADAVEAVPSRAEALSADPRHRGRWPAVTARAVAPLAELIELAFPLLAPDGCLIAWKRGDLQDELVVAERAMTGMGGGSIEVRPVDVPGLRDHRLIIATRRGRVPPGYPRDPATRRRRSW